jgi:PBP1b-binding outer membrane lipoprotein LpoB
MKIYILAAAVVVIAGCSSSKISKFDYSNVKSTSLDAQNYNTSPRNIMKDTFIETPQTAPLKNQAETHNKLR